MRHLKKRGSKVRRLDMIRDEVTYSVLKKQATDIPESTPTRTIIPSNEHGTGFMRNAYNPDYLAHLLSEQDFLKVVDAVNSLIRKAWTKKRILDN